MPLPDFTRVRLLPLLAALLLPLVALTPLAGREEGSTQGSGVDGLAIRGEVVFAPKPPGFRDARLNVYLEEVTELDLEAKILAHLVIQKVSWGPEAPPLRFTLGDFTPGEDASYNVRVHIDVDHDNKISLGDFISLGKNSVLVGKAPERLTIRVQKVEQIGR